MKTKYIFGVQCNVGNKNPPKINIEDCEIELMLDQDKKFNKISILAPGKILEFETKAHSLARYICNYIEKEFGSCVFKGLARANEIPETQEEKGGTRTGLITLQMEYCIAKGIQKTELSESKIKRFWSNRKALNALAEAKRETKIIDRYAKFYKVIEFLYIRRKGKAKEVLKSSSISNDMLNIISRFPPIYQQKSADKIIDEMVEARHKCNHLKEKFGYSSDEIQDLAEVSSLLPVIEEIAAYALEKHA
jgi:hypothetical protein